VIFIWLPSGRDTPLAYSPQDHCPPGIIEVLYDRTNQLLAPVRPVVTLRRDVDIRSAQKRAWQNKVAKGFNTTDIPLEFCLLQGETAKMAKNAARVYQPLPNGVLAKNNGDTD
jgi:hypothetical protein